MIVPIMYLSSKVFCNTTWTQ